MKAIRTKYHGATNRRGSRISASDEDGNRVMIPYPHELSGEAVHRKAAEALCEKMGWHGELASGSLKSGYVFVWVDQKKSIRSDGPPLIHQAEMSEAEIEHAHRVGAAMGYEQLAYTSTSALWGVYALPENPATWRGNPQALCGGCLIKTREFGLLFVQDLEDLHLENVK